MLAPPRQGFCVPKGGGEGKRCSKEREGKQLLHGRFSLVTVKRKIDLLVCGISKDAFIPMN